MNDLRNYSGAIIVFFCLALGTDLLAEDDQSAQIQAALMQVNAQMADPKLQADTISMVQASREEGQRLQRELPLEPLYGRYFFYITRADEGTPYTVNDPVEVVITEQGCLVEGVLYGAARTDEESVGLCHPTCGTGQLMVRDRRLVGFELGMSATPDYPLRIVQGNLRQ